MGNENPFRGSLGDRKGEGKALLESDHLLFRGDFRCKILFRDLAKVAARNGILTLRSSEGELQLELGERAAIWAGKILHPKSRSEKLGLKAGNQVAGINFPDPEFKMNLTKSAQRVVWP